MLTSMVSLTPAAGLQGQVPVAPGPAVTQMHDARLAQPSSQYENDYETQTQSISVDIAMVHPSSAADRGNGATTTFAAGAPEVEMYEVEQVDEVSDVSSDKQAVPKHVRNYCRALAQRAKNERGALVRAINDGNARLLATKDAL